MLHFFVAFCALEVGPALFNTDQMAQVSSYKRVSCQVWKGKDCKAAKRLRHKFVMALPEWIHWSGNVEYIASDKTVTNLSGHSVNYNDFKRSQADKVTCTMHQIKYFFSETLFCQTHIRNTIPIEPTRRRDKNLWWYIRFLIFHSWTLYYGIKELTISIWISKGMSRSNIIFCLRMFPTQCTICFNHKHVLKHLKKILGLFWASFIWGGRLNYYYLSKTYLYMRNTTSENNN